MGNLHHIDNYRTILDSRTINRGCGNCNTLECTCADLELQEQAAPDWLDDLECDGVCNRCWAKHSCITMEEAIPIHLLGKETIV